MSGTMQTMSPRGLRTTPVVLLIVLAFVLGSVSTATAASLTKGAVKKIAAKVVKKQAPSLSVAHAQTATTATTATDSLKVGGLTASQLGVRPIVFTIPAGPHVSDQKFKLPVPAGSYLLSLHGIVYTTAESFAECFIKNETQNDYPLYVDATGGPGRSPVMNGVGYETVNAGDDLRFSCTTDTDWHLSFPAHVTFTPVAGVVAGTLVPVRGSGGDSASR